MRVLLNATTTELAFTGGDNSYYRTLLTLNQKIAEHQFITLQHTPDRLRSVTRLLEIPVTRFALPDWLRWQLFAQARRVPVFRADVDQSGADVLFSTVLAARPLGRHPVPQVWYSQGISPAAYYDYFGRVSIEDIASLYRLVAPHVGAIVVGTHDCAGRLQEMCPELPCPVVVVPQVVLTEPLSDLVEKLPDETVHLLFVGRDYDRKGLPEVLAAYECLRDIKRASHLHIVTISNCPLQDEFAQLDNVSWYSNLSNEALHALYRKCHVLVAPTHADTYNLVLVEAMAYGCAVVSSDLAPMTEIAPNDLVGLIVKRGNANVIAEVLETLILNRDLLQRYMQGALARYKLIYAPQIVVPQILNVFEQVVVAN